MKLLKSKILMLVIAGILLLFFSNDFGLIDVEKTAIITAVAIDLDEDVYQVSAQIAVPEATDTNSEDKKALITGKGTTVGGAIKEIGNISGWFPKLSFCNLIILGNSLAQTNTIKVVDYFAKTLRVQDSATIILAEKTGKELLEKSSPLDNISSFALQKILLKNPGFDKNVAATDIKTFCSDYYSKTGSSKIPLVKTIEQTSESGGLSSGDNGKSSSEQGGSKSEQSEKCIFDATTTALFKDGVKVGELNGDQTLTYNLFMMDATETIIAVNDVNEDGEQSNYLLTILKNSRKICTTVDINGINLELYLDVFCKISDVSSIKADKDFAFNTSMPENVLKKAQEQLTKNVEEIILTQQQTGCDLFKIKDSIYRYYNKFYPSFKDNYLDLLTTTINVSFVGQQ